MLLRGIQLSHGSFRTRQPVAPGLLAMLASWCQVLLIGCRLTLHITQLTFSEMQVSRFVESQVRNLTSNCLSSCCSTRTAKIFSCGCLLSLKRGQTNRYDCDEFTLAS